MRCASRHTTHPSVSGYWSAPFHVCARRRIRRTSQSNAVQNNMFTCQRCKHPLECALTLNQPPTRFVSLAALHFILQDHKLNNINSGGGDGSSRSGSIGNCVNPVWAGQKKRSDGRSVQVGGAGCCGGDYSCFREDHRIGTYGRHHICYVHIMRMPNDTVVNIMVRIQTNKLWFATTGESECSCLCFKKKHMIFDAIINHHKLVCFMFSTHRYRIFRHNKNILAEQHLNKLLHPETFVIRMALR